MTDEIAQALGFDSAAEFYNLIANADITTPEKLAAFKHWQTEDGTKDGLIKIEQEKQQ